ncbi:RrF2 family transcriptional regulator [Nonomuraea sp. SYSU D8015]|uniref:RrF2 family transcriptional regulator n=1 Tax=Nonomuraea sp. SYSU D8015 TaxID=2593644 RepID=UPI00166108E6|nr:Rrf2 family transcriptional regulator [Nonomuraea sp. SYSU D8015]
MRISARTQYALTAMLALAEAGGPMHAESIAGSQEIPRRFCDNILLQLRRAGLVGSRRGPDGGYWLARPAAEIALADIIRVTEGIEPTGPAFPKSAAPLAEIWAELRAHEDRLLSTVTLADVLGSSRHDGVKERGGPTATRAPRWSRYPFRVRWPR